MFKYLYLFTCLLFCLSCNNESNDKIIIGISKASGSESYYNYRNWIKSVNDNIQIIDFINISADSLEYYFALCDGLMLTGGPDVHPGRFDKAEDTLACTIDEGRDTLEFKLFEMAMKFDKPILGVCRGMQLINIALGGDLIVDIPSDLVNHSQHQRDDKNGDAYHKLRIVESSLLYKIAGVTNCNVNSNHHQGLGRIANELFISARSEDGLAEALEWNNKKRSPWLMAVQWHPERYKEEDSFSEKLASEFIEQVNKSKDKKSK